MKKLLVIVGPTGTGKTDLAINIAKKFNGEVVSADSRQIYIGMDIGTGKLSVNAKLQVPTYKLEKHSGFWVVDGVPINLYDLINPDKTFSVAEYQQLAYNRIREVQSKGKLPILVGGTGLYIRAVVQGLKVPQVAPDEKLRSRLQKKPLGLLLKELEKADPKTYLRVDKSNPRRVIRALEVYRKTGHPLSSLTKKYQPDFDILQIGLTTDREVLYKKADERIESWIKSGFIDEVRILLSKYDPDLPAMSSLGYRQIAGYIKDEISLDEAKKRIKFDHHGYIRRQLTWFKREPNVDWFNIGKGDYKNEIIKTVKTWQNTTS